MRKSIEKTARKLYQTQFLFECLTIKLTGGQKRSFWTSSERSERQLSALLCYSA